MEICIRENYIDTTALSRTIDYFDENGDKQTKLVFTKEQLSQPPYNYSFVEIDKKYKDCVYSDFDCTNGVYSFNVEKYNTRKQLIANQNYENAIVSLIRNKYSLNQELAILRQRDTKTSEFAEYNNYVEQCKTQIKNKK